MYFPCLFLWVAGSEGPPQPVGSAEKGWVARQDAEHPPGDAAVPPALGTSRGNAACPRFPGLGQPSRPLRTPQARGNLRRGGPVRRVPGDATPSAAATASVAACYCAAELSQAGW